MLRVFVERRPRKKTSGQRQRGSSHAELKTRLKSRHVGSFRISMGILFCLLTAFSAFSEETRSVPNLTARDLYGNPVDLHNLLEKGPVLLTFWATWCAPCLKELPHIQTLYEQYKDKGFSVIAVSADSPTDRAKVRLTVQKKGLSFLVVIDDGEKIQKAFKIISVPTTVLIGRSGRIHSTTIGYIPGDERRFQKEVATLLPHTPEEAAERSGSSAKAPQKGAP